MLSIKAVTLDISSGFSFRGKVEHQSDGDICVIQLKDLIDDYAAIGATVTRVNSRRIKNKLFLLPGDVLFIAKGSNNYAIEYDRDWPRAIAVSAFFVLRPDPDKILPSYLCWYINQLPVQQYLKGNMAGTYVPNINKATIEGMMISVPSMDIQHKIVSVDTLRKRESLLMNQIVAKRQRAVSAALLNIAHA